MENYMKYSHIKLKPADNGLILSWDVEMPHEKNSMSGYEPHQKVFTMYQEEEAMSAMMKLHKENLEMYKEHMMKMKEMGMGMDDYKGKGKDNPGYKMPMDNPGKEY